MMDLSSIKLLAMDVDGTLTDGMVYMGPDGEAMKAFSIKDGYAIARLLPETGVVPAIITGRESGIVSRRCSELGINELHQGVQDKVETLLAILSGRGIRLQEVAYVGDDLNDLSCIDCVRNAGGFTACPADAAEDVRSAVNYVSTMLGGKGFVREIIEMIAASATETVE